MQPETRFKNKIRPLLERIPGSWWVKTQQVALRGVPDILGVIKGRMVAIELKVGDNKADPLQEYTLEQIRKAGGLAFVAHPKNYRKIVAELEDI